MLKQAGGYELVRATSSRTLEVIPTPADGYTVAFLKDVIGQGRIYVYTSHSKKSVPGPNCPQYSKLFHLSVFLHQYGV